MSEVMELSDPRLEEMKAVVAELARVKSRQDADAALAIYHPDGVLACPPMHSRAQGRAEIARALAGFFRFAPDYSVRLDGYGRDGDTLCAWGEIAFTPSSARQGSPNGAHVRTPVFILFQIRDGLVVHESFHFDLADVARQCGLQASAFLRAG